MCPGLRILHNIYLDIIKKFFLTDVNISHFHKFQNRQEGYNHLHTGRLFGQKLAKTEFTMLRGISFRGFYSICPKD